MTAVPGPLSLARRLARRPMPQTLPVSAPPALLEFRRHGALPLVAGDPDSRVLRIAIVIPSFRRGSGGHSTIADLVRGLEEAGHTCSLWLEDLRAGVEAYRFQLDDKRHLAHTAEPILRLRAHPMMKRWREVRGRRSVRIATWPVRRWRARIGRIVG